MDDEPFFDRVENPRTFPLRSGLSLHEAFVVRVSGDGPDVYSMFRLELARCRRPNIWGARPTIPAALDRSNRYALLCDLCYLIISQQRPDCVVYDEPLYAHFLRTHPEDETWRPYRDQVFKEQVKIARRQQVSPG